MKLETLLDAHEVLAGKDKSVEHLTAYKDLLKLTVQEDPGLLLLHVRTSQLTPNKMSRIKASLIEHF